MNYSASIDRDANRQVVQGIHSFKASNTFTFVAGTTGAVAAHTVFTVTGDVIVDPFAICNVDLTSGGAATVSLGVAGNVAGLIAVTTATDIDDGDIWIDATPGVGVEALPQRGFILNDGADIILDILTATLTAGELEFYILYRPLSSDGAVVATTPA